MCIFIIHIRDGYAENDELMASAYFDMGVFAFGEENYTIAIDNFKHALRYQPDNPYYIHFLGKAYMESAHYPEALKAFLHAQQLNVFIHELENDIAQLYFKLKQYDKACKLFLDIIRKDPISENIAAHYFAGLCFFNEKKYQQSISYLTHASDKNADIRDNCQFHISICLYRLNQKEKAIQSFKKLASTASSEKIKQMCNKWLKSIRQKELYRPYRLFAKISFQYDDNVGFSAPYLKSSHDDDIVLNAYVVGKYQLLRKNDYEIGAGYKHFQTIHQDLQEFDITGSTIDLYGKYKYDQAILGFRYQPSYFWVDHQRFMTDHLFIPQFTWKVTQHYVLQLSYTYANSHHFDNSTQNGHSHMVSWMNIFKLKPFNCSLFIDTTAEENHAAGSENQYELLSAKIAAKMMIFKDIQLKINSQYKECRYSHMDLTVNKKRNDHTIGLGGELLHSLNIKGLWGGIGYYYSHNNSNMDDYDYRKNVISMTLVVKY